MKLNIIFIAAIINLSAYGFLRAGISVLKTINKPKPGGVRFLLSANGTEEKLLSVYKNESLKIGGCEVSSGLLSGITNATAGQLYSTNISITEAYYLVKDVEYIYRSALKDANDSGIDIETYLEKISKSAKHYMDKRTVWDRRELIGKLDEIVETRGKFVCLLAGKSTGKSLVLADLMRRNKDKVILVDLRSSTTILSGLMHVLREFKPVIFHEAFKNFLKSTEMLVSTKFSINIKPSEFYTKKPDEQIELLDSFLEVMIKKENITTLVIDEANKALTIDDTTKDEKIEITSSVLSLFTKLTKQTKKLSIVLVSSEHAFPFRLRNPKLGFNTDDFTDFIYAGEVPPNEMFKLLREEWGIGNNLAAALISHYGGHVYHLHEALDRLRLQRDCFLAFDTSITSRVLGCLKVTDKSRMVKTLSLLVEKGFAPLVEENDPLAEVISRSNVGGVVKKYSTAIGLDRRLWGNSECGIIPASQSMRLIIAKALCDSGLTKLTYKKH